MARKMHTSASVLPVGERRAKGAGCPRTISSRKPANATKRVIQPVRRTSVCRPLQLSGRQAVFDRSTDERLMNFGVNTRAMIGPREYAWWKGSVQG
ncbi:septum formation initiator [Anopheles sinensis]|uniref:Septum formation initiator n=1 Tax=Anopheles sinensis TaxID=74873 RepID=A0A084WD39_ANOSI|nr:septum formation initiator [Anopheles sinensis]